MKKLISFLLIFMPFLVYAQEQEHNQYLIVWHKDGKQTRFDLEEQPVTYLWDDKLIISTGSIETQYSIEFIQRLTYDLGEIDGVNEILSEGDLNIHQNHNNISISGLKSSVTLCLFNMSGVIVDTRQSDSSGTIEFCLSDYPSGVYLLNINGQVFKFIKQ